MSSDPVLEVHNLAKTFRLFAAPGDRLLHALSGGRWGDAQFHTAVAGVSFTLAQGETLGIMGRNGAGKTTLLHLLAGTLTPTSGTLRRPRRVGTLIALGAGFDGEASGWANLRQWGALDPDGPFSADEEAWIADFTDLGKALDRPVKTYSQGMQLRLGFAVATARRPDLLIIDEVMAVGDFFFRRKCHDHIKRFISHGTAAVLVSHDYTEIIQFAPRALVLEGGSVRFIGASSDAVNRYLHSAFGAHADGQPLSSMCNDHGTDTLRSSWPAASQLVDLSSRTDTGDLTAVACCDGTLSQRWVFSQGEAASIFVEFVPTTSLMVPTITVMISDERGNLIHGNSSHMLCPGDLTVCPAGHRIRIRYDVPLMLRYGEYQVDVALGDIPPDHYRQRGKMTFEDLGVHTRILSRVDKIGVLAVIPRQGHGTTQLTHHGLADLPSSMIVFVDGPGEAASHA